KRSHFVPALSILLVLMLAGGFPAAAQNTATLSGTVLDPQGLGIKSAKVSLVNKSTGAERSLATDESGHFVFVSLAPGTYRRTVEGGPGLGRFANEGRAVTVGQEAPYDPQLVLRGVEQSTTVTATTTLVETTKTEVSQTVDQHLIDNLPINGRDF